MAKKEQQQKQKLPKIQNFKFHYSFNNFGRDHPQKYTWILGSKSGMFF